MSKEAAATFMRRAFEERALGDRVRNALAEHDGEAQLKRIGEEEGLAFTDEDFRSLRDDLVEQLRSGAELSDASLDAVSAGTTNIHEALLLVMKDSIREMNSDKKYFLGKLQNYDRMSEALSDSLCTATVVGKVS